MAGFQSSLFLVSVSSLSNSGFWLPSGGAWFSLMPVCSNGSAAFDNIGRRQVTNMVFQNIRTCLHRLPRTSSALCEVARSVLEFLQPYRPDRGRDLCNERGSIVRSEPRAQLFVPLLVCACSTRSLARCFPAWHKRALQPSPGGRRLPTPALLAVGSVVLCCYGDACWQLEARGHPSGSWHRLQVLAHIVRHRSVAGLDLEHFGLSVAQAKMAAQLSEYFACSVYLSLACQSLGCAFASRRRRAALVGSPSSARQAGVLRNQVVA